MRSQRTTTAAGALVRDLVRLVVPLACAGCGAPDVVVCDRCLGALGAGARRADLSAPRLARLPRPPSSAGPGRHREPGPAREVGDPRTSPAGAGGTGTDGLVSLWPVFAGVPYAGAVKVLVGSWKDRGRTDVTPVLAARFREVVAVGRSVVDEHLSLGYEVWVVPVPSTPSAVRRRGRQPTTELARVAAGVLSGARASGAAEIPGGAGRTRSTRSTRGTGTAGAVAVRTGRAQGTALRLVTALGHRRRRTLDQAGLGARDRASNLSGALRVRRRHRRGARVGAGRQVVCVLVDDVLTTGATLAECERALLEVGCTVVLGLVLAATPSPGVGRGETAGESAGQAGTASSQSLVVHSGRRTG